MPETTLLAAVDLGSNSFRLLIAKPQNHGSDKVIHPIDSVKRSVRLAAGLGEDQRLDAESQVRGLEALSIFSQRLRAYSPSAVRAVATSALRVARNAADFLADAQAVLGYPIEIITGEEEARLIWIGASHALNDSNRKLIIDIGGGSTECILGELGEPLMLDSVAVGCVSVSASWSPESGIDEQSFSRESRALSERFALTAKAARKLGWNRAIATSGTAKALQQIARNVLGSPSIDRLALSTMQAALLSAEGVSAPIFAGVKPDRRAVLPGGLLVMSAVFEAFGLESIDYCEAALRDGILLELSSALQGDDIRERSVTRVVNRYGIDVDRADRITLRALALFDQAARAVREERLERRLLLSWAGQLAEVGKFIARDNFHHHSAYILRNSTLAGFSHTDQQTLANLVLGQVGGLRKLRGLFADELGWLSVLALRIATLIETETEGSLEASPLPALFFRHGQARLEIDSRWLAAHPRAHRALVDEIRRWTDTALVTRFELREL